MEKAVITLLGKLRDYAREISLKAVISYHEEQSALMRFANSAISLNTSEHLVRLDFTAYDGRKKATYSMIANPEDLDTMKAGLNTLAEMIKFAEPLSYDLSFPVYARDVVDTRAYDPALAAISNEERLDYFNKLSAGLETADLQLSGIFMNGVLFTAQTSTGSEHCQFFASTDARTTAVISSLSKKWEVEAEQSAQKKSDLNPQAVHDELALLVKHYSEDKALQLPVGKYTVVFGPYFSGDVLSMLASWFSQGSAMKRGSSLLREDSVGKKILSHQMTIVDDPDAVELYGQQADMAGHPRAKFEIFKEGVFKGFLWDQEAADEYGEKPTGHDVTKLSVEVSAGTSEIGSLKQLLEMPRDEDILYIPYLHYPHVVNPSEGLLTGSSRFGALLLKKDGSIEVPYNVRLTQHIADFYGENLAWMSKETVVYNTSDSYGSRNPSAMRLPHFICVRNVEISHSNPSY